jgi:phosphohistidine phosphatase SixA
VRLYLVRHAEAAPGDPDELRRLTPAGREQARALGTRLAAKGVRPAAVLASPLRRARETGAELARATGGSVAIDDRLRPGATVERLREVIAGLGGEVIVVGHQPDCGRIAAQLTAGPEPRFPTAGMVVIDLPD